MDGLYVLSLFDGIDNIRLGLENIWVKIKKYSSQIDKNYLKVLGEYYNYIINLGDIRNIQDSYIKENIDLIIWWILYQDPSSWWKRRRLFYEFVHLKEILKCKYSLFENIFHRRNIFKI